MVQRPSPETVTLLDDDPTELYGRRRVLVWSDGHVAWRSEEIPPESNTMLDRNAPHGSWLRGGQGIAKCDRKRLFFAAPHESGFGTSRTCHRTEMMSAYRPKAE